MPAPRHRSTAPSGRRRSPASTSSPSRAAVASMSSSARQSANHASPCADAVERGGGRARCPGRRRRPPPRGARRSLRRAARCGSPSPSPGATPPARVASPCVAREPLRGLVEVTHGEHDVVDPHALPTLPRAHGTVTPMRIARALAALVCAPGRGVVARDRRLGAGRRALRRRARAARRTWPSPPTGALFFTEKETGQVRIVAPDGTLADDAVRAVPRRWPAARPGSSGIALHPRFDDGEPVGLPVPDRPGGRDERDRARPRRRRPRRDVRTAARDRPGDERLPQRRRPPVRPRRSRST